MMTMLAGYDPKPMPSMKQMYEDVFLELGDDNTPLDTEALLNQDLFLRYDLHELKDLSSIDTVRKWLDDIRILCPGSMLAVYDNMAFDQMLFWNMIHELGAMQEDLAVEKHEELLGEMGWMHQKWLKDFA